VFEPFGGSGTTAIACEMLNRECAVMELDPHYCSVIIERWQQFTGQKAELVG
jgi:DNA modification methylase